MIPSSFWTIFSSNFDGKKRPSKILLRGGSLDYGFFADLILDVSKLLSNT